MTPTEFITKARREAPISAIAIALSSIGQYYRVAEIRHLRRLVRELDIDCIFDVGANTGQYAQMLRRWVGFRGRIISFEPNPGLADSIIRRCGRDKLWTLERVALSSTTGSVLFNATEDSQFGSIERPRSDESSALSSNLVVNSRLEVPSETLSSAFDRLSSQFKFARPMLKMDTQGHDLSIFKSGINVTENFVAIQSELSFVPFYENVPLYQETIKEYEEAGFKLNAIFQNNRGSFPLMREMDCIMVNDKIVAY